MPINVNDLKADISAEKSKIESQKDFHGGLGFQGSSKKPSEYLRGTDSRKP